MSSKAIVIDNGSGFTKSGFNGDFEQPLVYDTLMCSIKESEDMFVDESNFYFGDEVNDKSNVKNVKSPLTKDGVINNWDDVELFWKYNFSKLNLEFDEISNYNVLISERALSPRQQKERITQILFEKFDVAGMYVINAGILGLYSCGRVSGVVCDIGEYITQIVSIVDGYPNNVLSDVVCLGSNHVNEVLRNDLIKNIQISKNTFQDNRLIRLIKERYSYTKEIDKSDEDSSMEISKEFKLPDGNMIDLNDQIRSNCVEVLFNPHKVGNIEENGIHKHIQNSIKKSSISLRNRFYSSIVCVGGGTMFEGFVTRMKEEITMIAPNNTNIEIVAPKERKYATYFGGSILSGLSQFQQLWINKDEYSDWGPTGILRKSFS